MIASGWTSERREIVSGCRRLSSMMMPKTIVVAPTTAVPMRTGLAVALNVLPAPSPFSSWCLAFAKSGLNPKSRSISAEMSFFDSICESSKTDWALSVTGPKLSTAIVTGPMPRNPKATRPKAKMGAANRNSSGMICWRAGCPRPGTRRT